MKPPWILAVTFTICLAPGGASIAQELELEDDYGADLPRMAPRSAEESLASFEIVDGFEVEIVATEPLVVDPISISFDEEGRAYVVCMRGYSEQADENLGQIRLLEDRDGDGRIETGSIFVDGLSWPTGVFAWSGGVFVVAAPDLHYFRDEDGDGVADERRRVLTGFGRGNVQGLVNSMRWGLDNRIHGATSSSGAKLHVVESGLELDLGRRDFVFDPLRSSFEAAGSGAQHGLSFDDWGRKFVCSNSSHLEAVLYDERALRGRASVPFPPSRRLIAVDGGQAPVFRRSPVEPWRVIRTKLRVAGLVPGPVEGGGRAAGYFTGATGATIYRGDNWPESVRGIAIIGDVGSNIVHRKRITAKGLGYEARRIDEGRELLASTETWFRPVQFANAPDGTLWVLDMYREVIEHPKSLPPMLKKHLDLTSGRDRGRIWRIRAKGRELRTDWRIDRSSSSALVDLLEHPNAWHRETAQRLLFEKQDLSVVARLERLALESGSAVARTHALWTLAGLDALRENLVETALGESHPRVREHAVKLSEGFANSVAIQRAIARLANDDDTRVRLQLALSLGEFAHAARIEALATLVLVDVGEPILLAAVRSSARDEAGELLARLARDDVFSNSQRGADFLAALARQIGGAANIGRDDIAAFLAVALERAESSPELSRSLLRAFAEARKSSGTDATLEVESLEAEIAKLVEAAKREAFEGSTAKIRADAIRTLALGRLEDLEDLEASLDRFLDSREPDEVQRAAIETLTRLDAPGLERTLLSRWSSLSPGLRAKSLEVLMATPGRLRALLDALEAGDVRAQELGSARLRVLTLHEDARIRERGTRIAKNLRNEDREKVVSRYAPTLVTRGDASRGRAVFEKNCSSCHRVDETGVEIGPNPRAAAARGLDVLLTNILDPNREVNPDSQTYVAILRDGRAIVGLLRHETDAALLMRRADGTEELVERKLLRTLQATGLSFMPEGLEAEIDVEAMADLFTFLSPVASTR